MSIDDPAVAARMPSFFIPHGGGPCFFMDWDPADTWKTMEAFLRGIADTLPRAPSAILIVSGHWTPRRFTVNAAARPALLFDYYGFPPHTYQLRYEAAGRPELAETVRRTLDAAGFETDNVTDRGLDHGVFIPLMLMFPEARIPVVQLSLRGDLNPKAHIDAGRALESLRDQDVLILGSGMSFHNMRAYGDPRFTPLADRFDEWLTATVEAAPAEREAGLVAWDQAPHARQCHPPGAEEHLLPLMVAAGAGGQGRGRRVFSDRVLATRVSGYRFD